MIVEPSRMSPSQQSESSPNELDLNLKTCKRSLRPQDILEWRYQPALEPEKPKNKLPTRYKDPASSRRRAVIDAECNLDAEAVQYQGLRKLKRGKRDDGTSKMTQNQSKQIEKMPPLSFVKKANNFRRDDFCSAYEDYQFYRFMNKDLSIFMLITLSLSIALVLWVPACIGCMNGVAPPPAKINWSAVHEHKVIPWLRSTPAFWFIVSSSLIHGIILCFAYYRIVVSRGRGWAIKNPGVGVLRLIGMIVFVIAGMRVFYNIGHPTIYSNTQKELILLPVVIAGTSFFISLAILYSGGALLKLALNRKP